MPKKKTTEEFIQDSIKVHGDKYDYSKVDYKNSRTNVIIVCKVHGEFKQLSRTHLNSSGCKNCSRSIVGNNLRSNTEKFIQKSLEIHDNKYDYSKTVYILSDKKVTIICKKHGEFKQTPHMHLLSKGCSKCSGNHIYTPCEFIQKSLQKHGNKYDYSKTVYIRSKEKVTIICKKHGEFIQEPRQHLSGNGCKKCTNNIPTNKEFIEKAIIKYGERFCYSKTVYKNQKEKVSIICREHGEFKQSPEKHMIGNGCSKCNGNYSLTTQEWVEKAVEVHGNRYDYSKSIYETLNKKVIIICPINKHGEFEQLPHSHLNSYGCRKCSGKHNYSQSEWIEKAIYIHGNKYDYSKSIYEKAIKKVSIICPIDDHGKFEQLPQAHINGYGCGKCANKFMDSTLFIKKAIDIHGDIYNYSKVNYKNSKEKVTIICKKHGEFSIYSGKHIHRKQGCPKCNMCPSCTVWKTNGKLCKVTCDTKVKKLLYQKSKEYSIVKYLREKLPDYDFIHNESVGSECTKDDKKNSNGHLFPDIRFDCGFYHLIVEVDEHRHRGADYKCDKQRMYNIIAKLGLPCIFIRYNPDSKESNKDILLEKLKTYLELDIEEEYIWDDFGYKSEYLFYLQPKILNKVITAVDIKKSKLVNKLIIPISKDDIKKPKYTKISLSVFTVKELKDICRTNGIV
jgi:hypothetical protein